MVRFVTVTVPSATGVVVDRCRRRRRDRWPGMVQVLVKVPSPLLVPASVGSASKRRCRRCRRSRWKTRTGTCRVGGPVLELVGERARSWSPGRAGPGSGSRPRCRRGCPRPGPGGPCGRRRSSNPGLATQFGVHAGARPAPRASPRASRGRASRVSSAVTFDMSASLPSLPAGPGWLIRSWAFLLRSWIFRVPSLTFWVLTAFLCRSAPVMVLSWMSLLVISEPGDGSSAGGQGEDQRLRRRPRGTVGEPGRTSTCVAPSLMDDVQTGAQHPPRAHARLPPSPSQRPADPRSWGVAPHPRGGPSGGLAPNDHRRDDHPHRAGGGAAVHLLQEQPGRAFGHLDDRLPHRGQRR